MNINECGCRPYGWLGLDGDRCIRVIPQLLVEVEVFFHTIVQSFYRPQTKFAKVMFLHLSVSHSVHRGVSASVQAGIHPPPEQTPPGADTPRSIHPSKQKPPPAQCMLGDTDHKRAVRILLECILVPFNFPAKY